MERRRFITYGAATILAIGTGVFVLTTQDGEMLVRFMPSPDQGQPGGVTHYRFFFSDGTSDIIAVGDLVQEPSGALTYAVPADKTPVAMSALDAAQNESELVYFDTPVFEEPDVFAE